MLQQMANDNGNICWHWKWQGWGGGCIRRRVAFFSSSVFFNFFIVFSAFWKWQGWGERCNRIRVTHWLVFFFFSFFQCFLVFFFFSIFHYFENDWWGGGCNMREKLHIGQLWNHRIVHDVGIQKHKLKVMSTSAAG